MAEQILIEATNITKCFAGNIVLDNVSLKLREGEILGLCGENGAGKSTLIKILSGAYQPDSGTITIQGHEYKHLTPMLARQQGIEVIHQEIILVGQLTIAENIFPTMPFSTAGFFSMKKTRAAAKELMERFGIELDPMRKVETLSAAEQQFVKILKALAPEPKILIMDEATAMFNMKDTETVLELVQSISEKGIGVIYISHHLKEVRKVAHSVLVLRDGKPVSTHSNNDRNLDLEKLTCDMVGRSVDMFYQREQSQPGEEIMRVENLQLAPDSPPVSFALRSGEILGITGMVGAGRSEIIRAVFGLDKKYAGQVFLRGEPLNIRGPADCIRHGIGFISEDRQKSGLVLPLSVLINTTILRLPLRGGAIDMKREKVIADEYINKLAVKTSGANKVVGALSGGNQQKVILGKWLHKGFDILFLDEPTKGIDVNAKFEIYKLLHELTKQGKSLVVVSSDMPEVISLCDRVLVVRSGKIRGEFKSQEITEENIIKIALEVS